MAGTTKAGVRRGTAADQQIDPLTQKVLVVATELLSGGRNPFAAVEGPSGLFDHGPYLEALEKYRDAGRESKLWEWSPSVHVLFMPNEESSNDCVVRVGTAGFEPATP